MVRGFFDDQTIRIPCPKCGEKIQKPIGWVKSNNHIACPGCGARIELETGQFIRELAKADRAIEDFKADIRRAFK